MTPGARRVLLFLGSSALAFSCAEAGSRALVLTRTPPGMLFEREVLYGFAPGTRIQGTTLNDIGCIGDDVRTPKVPAELRVLLLGGSTSFSREYVDDVRATLTTRCPGRVPRVVSCGRPRYTSYVNRVNFEQNLSRLGWDALGLYMGINDNIYDSFPWLTDLPEVGYFDARTFRSSIFVGLLKYHILDKGFRSRPDFAGGALRSEAIFEANVRALCRDAESAGAAVALGTFAVAWPTTDSALADRIRRDEATMRHFWGNIPSTVLGVGRHNEKTRAIARERDLPLAPVDALLAHDSAHFVDMCHLTAEGNRLLGRAMGESLAEALARRASVACAAEKR
jgi:hypothetical protein